MRSRASKGLAAGLAVVAVLALGACGNQAEPEADAPEPIVEPSGLQKAGTPLGDDVVVPEGSSLVGAVFPWPSEEGGQLDWSAYLTLDGDPFEVWDDLAGQFRDRDQVVAMPGSADSCTWVLSDPDQGPAAGEPVDTAPRPTDGSTTTTTATPEGDPYLEAVTITGTPPVQEVDGIECTATAGLMGTDSSQLFTMHLRSGVDQPATLTVTNTYTDAQVGQPTAMRTSLERQAAPPGTPEVATGPRSVPSSASQYLPKPKAQPKIEEDAAFGAETNCFASGKEERLVLPPGAAFLAGGFADGSTSVIRVISTEAAMAELRQAVAGDGTSEDGDGTVQTVNLLDGGRVTRFTFAVTGGGGCTATSSEDGNYIAISTHRD